MTMELSVAFLIAGLIALWVGGEGIVRSVMSYSKMFSIGAFVLSLTLLSAATSGPELFFNIFSTLKEQGELGVGNILGSNITNFALIFAIATLFIPMKKRDEEAIWAYPALFGFSLFFVLLGLDGEIGRIEGGMLVGLFILWMFIAIRGEHKKRLLQKIEEVIPKHKERKHIALTTILFIASVALLAGGAELLIRGIQEMSTTWNLSPFLLSALLVSIGTSLPELATIVVAIFRKRNDIQSGTIFGSNIFNISLIVGVTAMIHPITFSKSNFVFLGFLVIVTTMLAAPIIFKFKFQSRMWSLLLLSTYVFFLLYIISQITS